MCSIKGLSETEQEIYKSLCNPKKHNFFSVGYGLTLSNTKTKKTLTGIILELKEQLIHGRSNIVRSYGENTVNLIENYLPEQVQTETV